MGAHTEPPKQTSRLATLQDTPTKAPKAANGTGSPKVNFSFRREQSPELSPEAKKLMNEKREEAARIREQMVASDEGPEDISEAVGRKLATPKGKKGRFSAAHMEQFKKMDSIAGHASAFRVDPSKAKNTGTPTHVQGNGGRVQQTNDSPTKSLKRTTSKAQLDEPDHALQPHALPRSPSKPIFVQTSSQFPRSTSSKNLQAQVKPESNSPAKRMKRNAADDVSIGRPPSSEDETSLQATPQRNKSAEPLYPDLSTIASPTQASLARAASIKEVKSSKIPGPALSRSPSKATLQGAQIDSPKLTTPLLSRSPSKASLFSYSQVDKPKAMMSPLLMRSPTKGSTMKKSADVIENEAPKTKEAPLLSRSPLKMSVTKGPESTSTEDKASSFAPLLARSPFKMLVAKVTEAGVTNDKPTPSIPLLARSPAKVNLAQGDHKQESGETPIKASGKGLMGRFNLLRSSPMKSILRSPHRLYSNDPAKVAAGTHLATPPKVRTDKNRTLSAALAATAPVEKHVDFSNSTKARYERAQSELSSTPSKGSTSPPNFHAERKSSPKPAFAEYPALPSEDVDSIVTPQKRRQTAAPNDFTFRAGEHSIIFGQSPNAPPAAASNKRPSTIRHISAEPQLASAPPLAPATGSKKRKFDFENDQAVDEEMSGTASDKENDNQEESERPAKRVKPNAPEPATSKPASRPATLGVKPKKGATDVKDKKPSTISKARLNALAQPKRRA